MVDTRKTKTVKPETAAEFTAFEMPRFDASAFPNVEMPAAFRDMAEKSTAQFKAGYDKLKAAAEEATGMIEETLETARAGATELNLKTLDALKANTDATFAYTRKLFAVKTVSEMIELQTAFMKSQFEAFSAQAKDISAAAQRVATESSEPVKAAVAKTMKVAKLS